MAYKAATQKRAQKLRRIILQLKRFYRGQGLSNLQSLDTWARSCIYVFTLILEIKNIFSRF